MKKFLAVSLAALMGTATLIGAAACGESGEQAEQADRDAPVLSNAQATLSVNGKIDTSEDNAISDSLFGVFLEDINYASYALDDDLVLNGSFEALSGSGGKSYGWSASGATLSVLSTGGIFSGTGTAYETQNVNPNYAQLTVSAAGGKLVNSGYDAVPMAVEEGVNYIFSAFIKTDTTVNVTVSVTDGEISPVTGTFEAAADSSWVKYTRTFTATETASENLKLELSFDKAATVCLDGISFETTDSTVGIKNYLYEAISDLSPKFIRFPGGCVIEGTSEQEAYNWKNSIGAVVTGTQAGDDDVPAFSYKVNTDGTTKEGEATYGETVTRTPNIDIWYGSYYDMTYALGFYEYFLLCESLGASAVPVLNCGLSDQGGLSPRNPAHALQGRHGKYIEDYIQDAKDLIEFAKGDVSTKWGAIRASLGHAEPFEMDYLGIGNEQSGVYYTEYYEKFIAAFKEADDPLLNSVKLIVGNGMTLSNCEDSAKSRRGTAQTAATTYKNKGGISSISEYGVHDQHYYVSYADMLQNTTLYDGYARASYAPDTYYEVFVGEYSANSVASGGDSYAFNSTWANSWLSALSEAAMMTGYERNGDIVKLAAYAPMFANWNGGNQWQVDMMYYTNTRLVRSTNYYVQQLFMKNQGAYIGQGELTFADGFDSTFTLPVGGTNYTEANAPTVDKLYYVVSGAEDGDIIVKIVNASDDTIGINVKVNSANLTGIAAVTELYSKSGTYLARNTISDTEVTPEEYKIGFSDGEFGYTMQPYGVVCFRVRVK